MIELLVVHEGAAGLSANRKSPGSRPESDHQGAGAEAVPEVESFTAGTNDEL